MIYTSHGLMTQADLDEYRQDYDWDELDPEIDECPECGGQMTIDGFCDCVDGGQG